MIRVPAYVVVFGCALLLLTAMPRMACAQEVQTFSVMPFSVNGPEKYRYLSRGVQSMLQSRLAWKGRVSATPVSGTVDAPSDGAAAMQALKDVGSDFLVYGDVNVLGSDVSLNVNVLDTRGGVQSFNESTTLSGLIPSLDKLARTIGEETFGFPQERSSEVDVVVEEEAGPGVSGSGIIVNETTQGGSALNPQIRYEQRSAQDGVWRSRSMPFESNHMAVADLDNSGVPEVIFITDSKVELFTYRDGKLAQLGSYDFAARATALRVDTYDINRDGAEEVIVSGATFTDVTSKPFSRVYTFNGSGLDVLIDRVTMYFNTLRVPPNYDLTLLGQDGGHPELFDRGGVHEMSFDGSSFIKVRRLALPDDRVNIYNFGYVPYQGGHRVVTVDAQDHLRVFGANNELLAQTAEQYANSATGVQEPDPLRPVHSRPDAYDAMFQYYFVPNKIIPVRLGRDSGWQIIVNRNISVAAEIFSTFRNFPYGEMHSLQWDGVGLNLLWKTRRLNGTITGYDIRDFDGNGQLDLIVSLNTYPGPAGVQESRTVLYAFNLNIDESEFFLSPENAN